MKKFLKVYGFIVKDKIYSFIAGLMYMILGTRVKFGLWEPWYIGITPWQRFLAEFRAQKIYIKMYLFYKFRNIKEIEDLYKLNPEWV